MVKVKQEQAMMFELLADNAQTNPDGKQKNTMVWGMIALFALLVLISQFLLFYRDVLFAKPLEHLEVVSPSLTVNQSLSGQKSVTFKARIINHDKSRQPLTNLKLNLVNLTGEVFASRIFAPSEYLSKGQSAFVDGHNGLDTEFKIIHPEQRIVSFDIELVE